MGPPGTVDEAMQALARLTNYERTRPDGPRAFDLGRPRLLMERLGSPHLALGGRVVQVAGSKGKGSVARMLASIFGGSGARTGLYTSPHLESPLERIAVDGRPIGEREFADAIERTLRVAPPGTTFFEAMTAAACLHFAEAKTAAVVLEVGLGGRLDATTVVPTTHNVITTIGLEHTELLGDTLEAIAGEKAATIRPGVPVTSGVDPESAAGRVIAARAREQRAPLRHVPAPLDVVFEPAGLRWNGRFLPLLGRHQAHNAAIATAVAGVSPGTLLLPACCELRGSKPTVLLDGAHTAESVAATVQALGDHLPGARPELVFALGEDKRLDAIVGHLAPAVAGIHACRVDMQRGRPAALLAAHPGWGGRALAHPDALTALSAARAAAGPSGLVLVTGSLYLAGALRRHT